MTAGRAPSRLSRRGFWITLAVAVAVFLGIDNPLAGDAFAIDGSIAWSYLPIPIGVLVFLALERSLSLGVFVLETTLLAIAKLGVTASIAVALWTVAGQPQPATSPATADYGKRVRVADIEYRVAPNTHTRIGDASQVDEARVLAPSLVPSTRTVEVVAGQRVWLRAGERSLHTAFAITDTGRVLFNIPMLPRSSDRPVRFNHPAVVSVRCAVHPDEHYPSVEVRPTAKRWTMNSK